MDLRDHFCEAAFVGNIYDFKRAMAALEKTDSKVGNELNAAT